MPEGPPPAPAYMLSLLRRRLAAVGTLLGGDDSGFWLIWEPGRWSTSSGFDATISPLGASHDMPGNDSLTFHLKLPAAFRVGRSSACEVLINDATVSREHLVLEPQDGGWAIRVTSVAGLTELDGQPLSHGVTRALTDGATVRVGDVRLTFLSTRALRERLSR